MCKSRAGPKNSKHLLIKQRSDDRRLGGKGRILAEGKQRKERWLVGGEPMEECLDNYSCFEFGIGKNRQLVQVINITTDCGV
jgi:hypothetical protein